MIRKLIYYWSFVLAIMVLLGFTQLVRAFEWPKEDPDKMEWWRDARFGMFIHWGLYSQCEGNWKWTPRNPACYFTLESIHLTTFNGIAGKNTVNTGVSAVKRIDIPTDPISRVLQDPSPGPMKNSKAVPFSG